MVPVRSAYNALGGDDLVNYRTMSGSSVLLVANNEFTGTYNSFTGELRTANYQAKTTSGNLNLGTLTSGEINIGGSSQVKLNSYVAKFSRIQGCGGEIRVEIKRFEVLTKSYYQYRRESQQLSRKNYGKSFFWPETFCKL